MVDQHARVVVGRQTAQDLSELGRAELARSTGAGDAFGQTPDSFSVVGNGFLSQGGNSLVIRDGKELPP